MIFMYKLSQYIFSYSTIHALLDHLFCKGAGNNGKNLNVNIEKNKELGL